MKKKLIILICCISCFLLKQNTLIGQTKPGSDKKGEKYIPSNNDSKTLFKKSSPSQSTHNQKASSQSSPSGEKIVISNKGKYRVTHHQKVNLRKEGDVVKKKMTDLDYLKSTKESALAKITSLKEKEFSTRNQEQINNLLKVIERLDERIVKVTR